MLRGTRVISGEQAVDYVTTSNMIRDILVDKGLKEIILPSLWEQQTFLDKGGPEIVNQMWAFKDKKSREVCLIPEATALVQELWNSGFNERYVFYIQRCYRYERPQAGRYREFTQIGIELKGNNPENTNLAKDILIEVLSAVGCNFVFKDNVKRGLGYYTDDGFECSCEELGAQKQIAGGGGYKEGVGWAIGLDRLLLTERK